MKAQKNALKSMVVIGLASALPVVSSVSMAADGDIDFAPMVAGISATAAVAAIVGMGVVKLAPNFARWAINKVASFF